MFGALLFPKMERMDRHPKLLFQVRSTAKNIREPENAREASGFQTLVSYRFQSETNKIAVQHREPRCTEAFRGLGHCTQQCIMHNAESRMQAENFALCIYRTFGT